VPLAGVVLLSFVLNVRSLSVAGYGNTYYDAAVRSMTMSWKNFFFGSFDPGGFITVDKPPVFLWVDALSARIFGYSTWSILLPSAVAGAASVGLLWLIVRRYFGVMAATVAGLVLALTPVSVAVNRLNLPEPFMIFFLIGAAGATLQSLESRRWWAWTALAGCLVGVAFNTKMLAAWIPGPALALALIVATRTISWESARQLLPRLAVLGAVTLVVSASWLIVVDAWPASSRPYIGGSTNNTVLDLALGYNGFGRVEGTNQIGGGGGGRPVAIPGQGQRFFGGATGGPGQLPGGTVPGGGGQNAPTRTGGGGFAGPGGIFGGLPGALRMFDDANGGQIGWLLPFAVGGGLLALWNWRRDARRRAFAVLFLGWIGIYGGVFSYAHGIFHSYYTSAMAPGVAALVGVGSAGAASAVRRDKRWLIAVIALIGVTLWTQLQIEARTPDFYGWVRPLTVATALAGLAAIAVLALRQRPVAAGIALSLAGLLLLPAAWSLSASANASLNATLPQAGPQEGASGQTFGSNAFNDGTGDLAAWLKANSDPDMTWQLVVPSSQSGSRLIAQYGLSVMSLGGFLGRDNTISVAHFADLVSSGDVRYVLSQGGGRGGGTFGRVLPGAGAGGGRGVGGFAGTATSGPNAVLSAVQRACTPVSDPTLPATYQGALYDCAGAASAIRQTTALTS
jgi:4-amino-4-deoxy-L-arabinose transferase-like glycosyltransferase